ncbi:MAG: hypothetical protein P8Q93_07775 [Ascidiaceihabitans sp.]|nr:hypothetical protein [Ascidiaceihabitans sp.]
MKKFTIVFFISSIVAGCSQELEVRHGPQAIHPSDWRYASDGAISTSASLDSCGASSYQNLVGGPSKATIQLDIPAGSRHYGSEEVVATDTPSRLNFVHSGTDIESVTNPNSTVLRVFCG